MILRPRMGAAKHKSLRATLSGRRTYIWYNIILYFRGNRCVSKEERKPGLWLLVGKISGSACRRHTEARTIKMLIVWVAFVIFALKIAAVISSIDWRVRTSTAKCRSSKCTVSLASSECGKPGDHKAEHKLA
jgi:hypothetical protein